MRWVCWLLAIFTLGWRGHRWVFLFGSMDKAMALAHISARAGQDEFCVRCGALWEDAHEEHRQAFYAGIKPGPRPHPYR